MLESLLDKAAGTTLSKKEISNSCFPVKFAKFLRALYLQKDRLQKDRRVIHRVATNGNEWCNEWQRMTTSGTTSDNE